MIRVKLLIHLMIYVMKGIQVTYVNNVIYLTTEVKDSLHNHHNISVGIVASNYYILSNINSNIIF